MFSPVSGPLQSCFLCLKHSLLPLHVDDSNLPVCLFGRHVFLNVSGYLCKPGWRPCVHLMGALVTPRAQHKDEDRFLHPHPYSDGTEHSARLNAHRKLSFV